MSKIFVAACWVAAVVLCAVAIESDNFKASRIVSCSDANHSEIGV